MLFIHLSALFGIFCMGWGFLRANARHCTLPGYRVAALFLLALALRLSAAALSEGFGSDTACFAAWADRIFQVGPGHFYSSEVFTDYPPGYMYVLWLAGAARSILGLEYYSVPHLILLKLPAIVCDLLCGLLLFREASEKWSDHHGFFLCAAYLFNPAVFLNSSVWGQVDSVYTLAIVYMCLSLVRGRMYPACIAFGIGALIKPQMLLFAPLLLAGLLDNALRRGLSALLHSLFQCLCAALGTLILCLPFGLEKVWTQYAGTLNSYPYAAVNAYNFWGFLGLNWVSQDDTFLGIPYRFFGMAAIAGIVILVLFLSVRSPGRREKYPFLGALLVITVFLFSVRMHERYMYPGLILLLFAFAHKPSPLTYLCYAGFSVFHFYNTADVLFFYDPANYDRKAPLVLAVSAGMLLCGGLLHYIAFRFYGSAGAGQAEWPPAPAFVPSIAAAFQKYASGSRSRVPARVPRPSVKSVPLRKKDFLCMLTVTAVYSAFALHDLGDAIAPDTSLDMVQNQSVELDFGSGTPSVLSYYIAPWHNRPFTLEGRAGADLGWDYLGEITLGNVFTWQELSLEEIMAAASSSASDNAAKASEDAMKVSVSTAEVARSTTETAKSTVEAAEGTAGAAGSTNGGQYHILRFTLNDTQASLLEFTFLDADGQVLTPVNAADYPALFDEAGLHPEAKTFRNSMYFDEIYHGRTAYEFLHGLTSYENTHPPMGKIFIALGIAAFGMNPFGWRIVGVLFGIAMVPLLYLFAKRLTASTLCACAGSVIFAFDFMHFSQTRIATIDVYITFFVLLMYYFMYRYAQMSFYDTSLRKTWLPLGACGISMGFGIACKWTGFYAGAGLALIFFCTLCRRYLEYRYAREDPSGASGGISHRHVIESFAPSVRRTVLFCVVFFVIVPAVIYLLSYLPFRDYSGRGLVSRMLYNQKTMFQYHSSLDATHAYSSAWYEWPVISRPVWYYSRIVRQEITVRLLPSALTSPLPSSVCLRTAARAAVDSGLREGISAFGNPAVWWAGIPALVCMSLLWARKRDRTAAFLVVGYFAQYLPWFFVTRITFIYHYFPSVVFVVLMILHSLAQWRKRLSKTAFFAVVSLYCGVVVALFLLFYPVLSGQPVEASFVDRYLRWLPGWVLTAR